MIVKIKDFGWNNTVTDPLNTQALLESVELFINGSWIKHDTIVDNEIEVVYLIGDDPNAFNVRYNASRNATVAVNDSNLPDSVLVSVTSEDALTTNTFTVTFTESTDQYVDLIRLYSIQDGNTDFDIPLIYDTISGQWLAKVPYFDNAEAYFDLDFQSNFQNATDMDYISFNGDEPDSHNPMGTLLTAFDVNEQSILDAGFVYLKLTRSTYNPVYVKLEKSISIDNSQVFIDITKKYNDSWVQLFFGVIVTEIIEDAGQLETLESCTTIDLLIDLLESLQIEYVNISLFKNDLLDYTAIQTEAFDNLLSPLLLHNSLDFEGLSSVQIERLDKAFAKWMYDALSVHSSAINIPDVLKWLHYIWNPDFTICSDKLESSRLAYYNQSGINVQLMLSTRLLKHLLSWLQYVQRCHRLKIAKYKITDFQLEQSIFSLEQVLAIKTLYQFDQYSVLASKTFFDSIESLQKETSVLMIGDWN